jgi:hypothetical protein
VFWWLFEAWTARPAEIEFVFIGFCFSGDERLICRVTGPRRFPPPNHAKDFELFFLRFLMWVFTAQLADVRNGVLQRAGTALDEITKHQRLFLGWFFWT